MEPLSVIIKPTNKFNRPDPPTRIDLHGLDLISAPVHISNHRFFKKPPHLTIHEIVDKLKSSLAEALELYPPVAGTVRADEQGIPYIAVDGEGAIFQLHILDDAFVTDGEFLSPRPVLLLPTPSCALAVKVTLFSCGTLAICSSLHHWLADLRGFLDFLAVWAQRSRHGHLADISSIPHDWFHTPSQFFEPYQSTGVTPPLIDGYKVATDPSLPIFSAAEAQAWKITENSLAKLKDDFSPPHTQNSPTTWISSGDALTALLWGAITRARERAKVPHKHGFGRSSEESGTETIATAADGRERSPNKNMLGDHYSYYFGNFNLLFMTTVPRPDLLSEDVSAASRIALALRESLNRQLTPKAIAERIQFMDAHPHDQIVWSADVAFTNWCRFDLEGEDMDFGWGKPFDATAGAGIVPGGFVRLLQKKQTGDVNILISVEKEGGHAMKTDLLLNKYAKLIKVY